MIRDIMAFSHVLPNMSFFYAGTAYGRGFFFITMEFFDASPSFVPKTSLTQPKKKKTKEGGGYMSDSPTARRTNILVNT